MPPLVSWTDRGLFCEAGGFYIDPHRPVDVAVVTHAHSDHARRGSKRYLCAASGLGLLRVRLGQKIQAEGVPYGERFQLGEVTVSFHPAGHILGSAQVRIERRGEVWVCSGDYKREADPSCEAFETVRCDTFITEATFGTPSYVWDKTRDHGRDIYDWWRANAAEGKNSVLNGYSLGKTQRILAELAEHAHRPVLLHDTAVELTECYRREGQKLAPTVALSSIFEMSENLGSSLRGELILAPPSWLSSQSPEWMVKLGDFETAFASGWMKGSAWGRGSYEKGFVMSDHADWEDLNRTIDETGAGRVFVLHRENGILIRNLRRRGLDAHPAEALREENYTRLGGVNLGLF